jgi:hypothetical protein
MKLTVSGVDDCADHFATAAEQSQHVDQFIVIPAELGADHLGMPAVFPQGLDRLSERDRVAGRNRGTLLDLGQARTVLGTIGRRGGQAYSDSKKDSGDKLESRHGWGDNGVPVNAT